MFHGVHFRQYPVGIQIQIWDGCRFHSAVVPVATSNRIAEIVNFAEAFPPQSCIQEREREREGAYMYAAAFQFPASNEAATVAIRVGCIGRQTDRRGYASIKPNARGAQTPRPPAPASSDRKREKRTEL